MHRIAKQLGLGPLDTVRLIETELGIKKRGFMDINDFRELLVFCPGLTSQLCSVTGIRPCDMSKIKVDVETYLEMKSEYKERIGIKLF